VIVVNLQRGFNNPIVPDGVQIETTASTTTTETSQLSSTLTPAAGCCFSITTRIRATPYSIQRRIAHGSSSHSDPFVSYSAMVDECLPQSVSRTATRHPIIPHINVMQWCTPTVAAANFVDPIGHGSQRRAVFVTLLVVVVVMIMLLLLLQ
jgi:hypothetical protein